MYKQPFSGPPSRGGVCGEGAAPPLTPTKFPHSSVCLTSRVIRIRGSRWVVPRANSAVHSCWSHAQSIIISHLHRAGLFACAGQGMHRPLRCSLCRPLACGLAVYLARLGITTPSSHSTGHGAGQSCCGLAEDSGASPEVTHLAAPHRHQVTTRQQQSGPACR